MRRFSLLLLPLSLTLAGCAPGSPTQPQLQPAPAGPSLALPAPARELSGLLPPGTTSCTGAQYDPAWPAGAVSPAADQAVFAPDWSPTVGPAEFAFASYVFTLPGYAGTPRINLEWADRGSPELSVWLGLANWSRGSWDWQPSNLGGEFDPLHNLRGDGTLAAVVLLLGPASAGTASLGAVSLGPAPLLAAGDLQYSIDNTATGTPISPLIYGLNRSDGAAAAARPALVRLGGNRWTAYNWETNASNAGSDWFHQNDGYMGGGEIPGEAVRGGVQAAFDAGAAAIVTVPIQGQVAADKLGDGDVSGTPDYIHARFHENLPAKGAPFSLPPDTTDDYVYQDEFGHWLNTAFPGQLNSSPPGLLLSLDNEPDLWAYTHARIQPDPVGYDELIDKSIASLLALRAVAPQAQFLGAVNYGWYGYATLQDAPDAGAKGNFLDYYLTRMAAAEVTHGQRLLNVLDVHWYPEARGGGVRITENDSSPAVVAARLQAARSLWDTSYVEDSWISSTIEGGAIYLLPRLKAQIAAHYPGTQLAITEYNYGAGGHISGGLAEADVLGVFGREGLYAACMWDLSSNSDYILGALALYRNCDGAGRGFGDVSLPASCSENAAGSGFASAFSGVPGLAIVALNKTATAQLARFELNVAAGEVAEVWRLDSDHAMPVELPALALPGASFNYSLPAYSATLLLIR